LLAVLIAGACYLPLALLPHAIGFVADDALYLLMADAFSPFHPRETVLEYVRGISHLPPLYPLVLALLGGGSDGIALAFMVQGVCLVVALALCGRLAARMLADDIAGLLVLVIMLVALGTVRFSTEIWSEFLYLALAGGTLLCAERPHSRRLLLLAAACAGLAAITRGAGITLLVALLVTVAARMPRALPAIAAVALSPLVICAMLGVGGGIDYLDILRSKYGEADAIAAVLEANLRALGAGTMHTFVAKSATSSTVAAAILAPLALLGWAARWRECAALYTLMYVTLLVVWPFPAVAHRLVYPLVPLILIYAAYGARVVARHSSVGARSVLAIIFIGTLCASAPLVARAARQAPPAHLAEFHASRYWLTHAPHASVVRDLEAKRAMTIAMHEARRLVGAETCIYALDPQAVMFHTRRLSWPPERGARRPARPRCAYHLLLSDAKLKRGIQDLWPHYEVRHVERVADGVAAILVYYPQAMIQ
jgi:hypothetical protein